MKKRFCISFVAVMVLLAVVAFPVISLYSKSSQSIALAADMPETDDGNLYCEVENYEENIYYEVESEDLNSAWLFAQSSDPSSDSYNDLVCALYVIHCVQYGTQRNYADAKAADESISLDALLTWMDMMGFEYKTRTLRNGMRIRFSNVIYMDIAEKDDVITQMDLVMTNIHDAYDNSLRIVIEV